MHRLLGKTYTARATTASWRFDAFDLALGLARGMEVVDVIVSAPRNEMDRPQQPTTITSTRVRDAREDEKGVPPLPGLSN